MAIVLNLPPATGHARMEIVTAVHTAGESRATAGMRRVNLHVWFELAVVEIGAG